MFTSPCTLRSASCAALIALATAAGIVRVQETTAAEPVSAPPTPVVAVVRHIAATALRIVRRIQIAVTVRLFSPRVVQMPAVPPRSKVPGEPPHRLPFAVGPPPFRTPIFP
jgi:hypothetical protein